MKKVIIILVNLNKIEEMEKGNYMIIMIILYMKEISLINIMKEKENIFIKMVIII